MNIWVAISPLIGRGSVEGFAAGVTLSGALFLAITVPRRSRRRQAAAVTRGVPVSRSSAEASVSSAEAGAFDLGLYGVGALRAEAERVVQLPPGARDEAGWTSLTGRDGRPAAYQSRHRLGDPRPGGAFPPGAFPGWASRGHAQPEPPARDVTSTDVTFREGAFRSARRSEVRRLPRHAAPTVRFGARVTGRVMGLFAARPLAGGAAS
jgi:hypothetical protein